jgi:LemA protein
MKGAMIGCAMVGGGLLLLLLGIGGCGVGMYNGMATGAQACDAQWSQVENVYQRRNDLVPNIVASVKGYMGHEHAVIKEVAEAQASVGRVTIDPKNLTPELFEKWSAAQVGLGGALQKLMSVAYSQPNIKADEGFRDLRATLEGSENRIALERKKFNEAVQDYNNKLVSFPTSMMASWGNFKAKPYFKADEAAKTVPKVDFSK